MALESTQLVAKRIYMNPFENIIGNHPCMQKVRRDIQKIARDKNSEVLIYGPSGSGKELAARAIHELRARANEQKACPFIPVNCMNLTHELSASALFGHIRGAFTGAHIDKKGLFQAAHNGILFFDEIGDLPLDIQGKLLRVLDSGEETALGSTQFGYVNVQVIAATNKDLEQEVAAKRFRRDLLFRLDGIMLDMPSLSQHVADIPLFVDFFFKHRAPTKNVTIKNEVYQSLGVYLWPGNVRELNHVLEKALFALEDDESVIELRHLPWFPRCSDPSVSSFLSMPELNPIPFKAISKGFEYERIDAALAAAQQNKTAAAVLLGMKRTTLTAKLRRRNGTHAVR